MHLVISARSQLSLLPLQTTTAQNVRKLSALIAIPRIEPYAPLVTRLFFQN